MEYDVIVAGAGASGLVAAIAAARLGSSVLVIEHMDKAGKKILATGNGKCNFTNSNQSPQCYRSDDSAFARKVLSCFDVRKTLGFFEELGICPMERGGYYYPNSEQAASVVRVLLLEGARLGIAFRYGEKVTRIDQPGMPSGLRGEQDRNKNNSEHRNDFNRNKSNSGHRNEQYQVTTETPGKETYRYMGKHLILATGGCASPQLGSDGSGYALAKGLGHRIIKPLPALVQLRSPDKACRTVSGVRTQARVTAYADQRCLAEEEGEVCYTDYGISGIPVLQMSRYISKALDQGKNTWLSLDYRKDLSEARLTEQLRQRMLQNPDKTVEELLLGMLNHKLGYILIKAAKVEPAKPSGAAAPKELEAISHQMKHHRLAIHATNPFENAQVCAGGVATDEIDPSTMESRLVKGLYFGGELIDVDGTCGGYNLQWAWSSGHLAGTSAAGRNNSHAISNTL